MKKLSILLSALLVISLAGCEAPAEEENAGALIDEINEGLEEVSAEIGDEVEEFEEGLEEGGEALEDSINSLFE